VTRVKLACIVKKVVKECEVHLMSVNVVVMLIVKC